MLYQSHPEGSLGLNTARQKKDKVYETLYPIEIINLLYLVKTSSNQKSMVSHKV